MKDINKHQFTIHGTGKKNPLACAYFQLWKCGMGILHPKKAIYNRVYHLTTFGLGVMRTYCS